MYQLIPDILLDKYAHLLALINDQVKVISIV